MDTITLQAISIIAVSALCTIILRMLPFLIFGGKKEIPTVIQYLGNYLPASIMATLVIYCIRTINFFQGNYGLLELASILFVIILHLWKRNVILSVGLGTICYMLLIRFSFMW